jgi:hypothetical protein
MMDDQPADNLYDIAARIGNRAPGMAVANIEEDPAKGAEAFDLSHSTDLPSLAVYHDFDNIKRNYKAGLAASMVRNSPELRDYVNSHPLASIASNDDYGNLSQFSAGAKGTAQKLLTLQTKSLLGLMDIAGQGQEAAVEGFGPGQLGSGILDDPRAKELPAVAAGAATAIAPFELAYRGSSALISGAIAAAGATAEKAYSSVTGDASGASRFGREISAVAEMMAVQNAGELPEFAEHSRFVKDAEAQKRANEAYTAGKQWLDAGVDVPTGVHPLFDQYKAITNVDALANLNADLARAQESLTRERSPELFQKFVEQHYGQSEIGISGDRVAALYGDGTPTPDDGLLGWVPEIEDKLALARETGDDVTIPISDWLTKVDPKVAADLNDDIRVWPGGITAAEAAPISTIIPDTTEMGVAGGHSPIEYKPFVDSPLAAVRAGASLEPMFSIGDRKLTLARMTPKTNLDPELQAFGPNQGFHDFNLVDQNGNTVGYLNLSEQKGGKQVYVDMVSGVNGLGARDFGPSLVFDMFKQIAAEFPNAETLTGHRVSGARDVAGTYNEPSAHPVIDLNRLRARAEVPEGWDVAETANEFRKVLEGGEWLSFHPTVDGYLRPLTDRPEAQIAAIQAVQAELARIVPKGVVAGPVERLVSRGAHGQGEQAIEPTGVYIPRREANSILLYALDHDDIAGTARHEAIHHLRNAGFFDEGEWSALEAAAKENGWVERFGIKDRYPQGEGRIHLEESIADAYKEWEAGRGEVGPTLHPIFQKMKDFFDAIRKHLANLFGREPTWEDIFEKVSSGEVGGREGTTPLHERASLSVPEDSDKIADAAPRPSFQDQLDRLRANATGLDLPSYKRLQELIQSRYAEDLAKAQSRAEAQQKREQTREWRNNKAEMSKQVEEATRSRPDVAADLFLGSGELFGKKLDTKYRLARGDLTDEQAASLPSHYLAKSGLPVDQVAKLFGFTSGDALVDAVSKYNAAKGGKSPQEAFAQIVRDRTNQQMQAKYGDLQGNILDEAKDQALSETNLNLLAEEMYAAASMAKVQAIDKATALEWAKDQFSKMSVSAVSADRFMDTMAKHGRDAERSLIAGDPATALVSMQKKYLNAVLASMARTLTKEIGQFEKTAKRFASREVKGIDPEYTTFIHQILQQVGKPVRRSADDIAKQIAAGVNKDLESFVADKSGMMRELPVMEDLYDPNWKREFAKLTTDEFRGVAGSIKALVHNGRDELRIEKAGESAALADIRDQMVESLERFKAISHDAQGQPIGGIMPKWLSSRFRMIKAAHFQLETIFNRFDRYDPQGVWNQYAMRGLVEGANQESAWRKEYAEKIKDLHDGLDMGKLVDNTIFREPQGNGRFGAVLSLNRGNLRAIMLNTGTKSNLVKLARGYGRDPADVMNWIHTVAKKEDWDFVQKVWDTVFKDIKSKSDRMYRSLTGGVPSEDIPASPISTPFGNYDGGYYPVIYHPEFEGESKKMMGKDPLEQDGYNSTTTPAGYMKSRTGYVAPISLDLDMLPGRVSQMLHDIALRPAVLNASKIFYDPTIRSAMFKHYGGEYRDLLIPYLRDVANAANYMSRPQKMMAQTSEFIRQNMITTLVGLNPGTVLKHGPTAWVQSMQEVGPGRFLDAVKSMFSINEETGETNWAFAKSNSQELQRRDVNWKETLGGAVDQLVPKAGIMTLRQNIISLASKPVALSDMISAVPTWLAKYKQMMEDGAAPGDAIYEANRAVRRAHGSTAITNRPGIMRDTNPWLTSVYNFFNHIMNRQAEMVWRAGEAMDLAKDGEWRKAKDTFTPVIGQLFSYVIVPAIVEELVSPMATSDGESWGKKAAKGLAFTLGASWVGVRDLVNAMLHGSDPSVGLATTAAKTMTDIVRDFAKDRPFSRDHAGRLIQDATTLAGTMTGAVPAQVGRVLRFGQEVHSGEERPRGPWGWLVGLRYGTTDHHSKTWDDWIRGRQ